MKLITYRFGEIDADLEQAITFEQGIPGFEGLRTFLLIPSEPEIPFGFLQSIEDGDVSFVLANPFAFFPEYEFELSETAKEDLDVTNESDCAVWSIVTIKEKIQDATLNLLAPIMINVRTRQGKQIILNGTPYKTKHALPSSGAGVRGKEETSDAGAVAQEE